jgi:hypothetical protein
MCPVSAVLGSKIVVDRSVALEQNWVLFRGPGGWLVSRA